MQTSVGRSEARFNSCYRERCRTLPSMKQRVLLEITVPAGDVRTAEQLAAGIMGRRGGAVSGKRRWEGVSAEERAAWSRAMIERRESLRAARREREKQETAAAFGVRWDGSKESELALGVAAFEEVRILRLAKKRLAELWGVSLEEVETRLTRE